MSVNKEHNNVQQSWLHMFIQKNLYIKFIDLYKKQTVYRMTYVATCNIWNKVECFFLTFKRFWELTAIQD